MQRLWRRQRASARSGFQSDAEPQQRLSQGTAPGRIRQGEMWAGVKRADGHESRGSNRNVPRQGMSRWQYESRKNLLKAFQRALQPLVGQVAHVPWWLHGFHFIKNNCRSSVLSGDCIFLLTGRFGTVSVEGRGRSCTSPGVVLLIVD